MYNEIYRQINSENYQMDIPTNKSSIPDKAGIYAIYANNNTLLPKPFSTILHQRNSKLLYIGKSEVSLRRRLYEQDLCHERPSTFFRSLGAVLGYLPPKGSLVSMANKSNYKFSPIDTKEIIQWIQKNLSIYWSIKCEPQHINSYEKILIFNIKPIFNIQNNPEKSKVLKNLRRKCKKEANINIIWINSNF